MLLLLLVPVASTAHDMKPQALARLRVTTEDPEAMSLLTLRLVAPTLWEKNLPQKHFTKFISSYASPPSRAATQQAGVRRADVVLLVSAG